MLSSLLCGIRRTLSQPSRNLMFAYFDDSRLVRCSRRSRPLPRLGKQWKELSAEERKAWQDKALAEKKALGVGGAGATGKAGGGGGGGGSSKGKEASQGPARAAEVMKSCVAAERWGSHVPCFCKGRTATPPLLAFSASLSFFPFPPALTRHAHATLVLDSCPGHHSLEVSCRRWKCSKRFHRGRRTAACARQLSRLCKVPGID